MRFVYTIETNHLGVSDRSGKFTKFARPSPPSMCRFAAYTHDQSGTEGLAARLQQAILIELSTTGSGTYELNIYSLLPMF